MPTVVIKRVGIDAGRLREDFPALQQQVHGQQLVYLDSAASSQTPKQVIEAMAEYYEDDRSNVHRGVHELSQRATEKYESARTRLQRFLNVAEPEEVIWTRGTTESINLVAAAWGRQNLGPDDEVLVSEMEHHSNIVPWQILCQERGAHLKVIPMNVRGELAEGALDTMLSERVRIVAVTHVSNALGTVNPVREIAAKAHAAGALCLVDGAQSVPHMPIDVQEMDCDFFALSGHKMCGPTGIGALYAKRSVLETMAPYQSGGDMIASVTFEHTEYNDLPHRFEAGTPAIAEVIGMGAAVDYLKNLGMDRIQVYERDLLAYGTERLSAIDGLRLIGTAQEKAAVLTFALEGTHPADVGTLLDHQGIAVRVGHHCAEPAMRFFGLTAAVRASFSFYNSRSDFDGLAEAVEAAKEILS